MKEQMKLYGNEVALQQETPTNLQPIILKFGGTSVGSVEGMQQAAYVVADHMKEGKVIVVVSAMSGATNQLLDIAMAKKENRLSDASALLKEFKERHDNTLGELNLDRDVYWGTLKALQNGYTILEQEIRSADNDLRLQDRISIFGEISSAILLSAVLRNNGIQAVSVDARDLLVSDDKFTDANVDIRASFKKAKHALDINDHAIPVVTGFIAATEHGESTTLGRGGSDKTAILLGILFDAREVHLLKRDVDGVYSEDPNINPAAIKFDELKLSEAEEIAESGARVVALKALTYLRGAGKPVWIRNTNSHRDGGTYISPCFAPLA